MKIAIVHEWLTSYSGSEKVLGQILSLYPKADLYSLVDFLPDNQRSFLMNKKVHTSFIQNLPKARTHFRRYLALMPLAIEQFDLRGYDLVISSSHCVAKGVLTGPDQLHISYVHSPIRYAWDLQRQYLQEAGLSKGIKGWIAKIILHYMRLWDTRTANGVDYYIANSHFIEKRIWKCYRREATIIYPPVDISAFSMKESKEEFYITVSRNVPYKKINAIVQAFNTMPEKKLVVIGADTEKLCNMASKNVCIMGEQPFEVLLDYMQRAKAFVFAAEEDFGITTVEAQACGTPVIAYGKGGSLEIVITEGGSPTGLFFYQQTSDSIKDAIHEFEINYSLFKPQNCRSNAERFGVDRFRHEFDSFVNRKMK